MKIVVIGGTGLIGSQVVRLLRANGHEVTAASPSTGVNAFTGEGLAAALEGAKVVVDVANSPSFEDKAVLEFFETSGRHLMAAESAAGVGHHVALSVVGTQRLPGNGYFRAKLAQENLIKSSGIPFTIVQATQFFEFMGAVAHTGADGDTIRVSSAHAQPIAAQEVAPAVAQAAEAAPLNGTLEIAGPDRLPLSEIIQQLLTSTGDSRRVIGDPRTPYFGSPLEDSSLTPAPGVKLGIIRFQDWLSQQPARQ
ncbi:MAG: SDR family oxidoreductase [Verrucomicrobiaceae bacterium]|nr:MAG: SDR family oxidoreductase [Verrucomicrobiaceae bacterium]